MLDPEEIEKLSFRDKMGLYSLLEKAHVQSLDFLFTLHQSVPSITENLGILEKFKKDLDGGDAKDLNVEDKGPVRMVRSILLEAMRKKHRAGKERPKSEEAKAELN